MIHDSYVIRLYSLVKIGWYKCTVIQEETNCYVIVNVYHELRGLNSNNCWYSVFFSLLRREWNFSLPRTLLILVCQDSIRFCWSQFLSWDFCQPDYLYFNDSRLLDSEIWLAECSMNSSRHVRMSEYFLIIFIKQIYYW